MTIKNVDILDYFFFSRPILFFPAWSTLLMFTFLNHHISSRLIIFNPQLILKLLIFALAMASSFVFNQIKDIETDRINNKLYFLPRGIISVRNAYIFAFSLAFVAISLSYLVSNYILYLTLIFLFITAYAYNFKPFSWKNTIYMGAIANLAMGYLASLYALNSLSELNYFSLIALNGFNFVLFILTTVIDKKGDLASKKNTLGNYLNKDKLIILLLITLFVSLLFCQANIYLQILLSLSFILILLYYFTFLGNFYSIDFVIKFLLILQAILVCTVYYDYLILIVLMYFGARAYYKKRFNVSYPNLKRE